MCQVASNAAWIYEVCSARMTYHNTAFANANIGSSWAIDPEFRLSMGAHTAVLGYLRIVQ